MGRSGPQDGVGSPRLMGKHRAYLGRVLRLMRARALPEAKRRRGGFLAILFPSRSFIRLGKHKKLFL